MKTKEHKIKKNDPYIIEQTLPSCHNQYGQKMTLEYECGKRRCNIRAQCQFRHPTNRISYLLKVKEEKRK